MFALHFPSVCISLHKLKSLNRKYAIYMRTMVYVCIVVLENILCMACSQKESLARELKIMNVWAVNCIESFFFAGFLLLNGGRKEEGALVKCVVALAWLHLRVNSIRTIRGMKMKKRQAFTGNLQKTHIIFPWDDTLLPFIHCKRLYSSFFSSEASGIKKW